MQKPRKPDALTQISRLTHLRRLRQYKTCVTHLPPQNPPIFVNTQQMILESFRVDTFCSGKTFPSDWNSEKSFDPLAGVEGRRLELLGDKNCLSLHPIPTPSVPITVSPPHSMVSMWSKLVTCLLMQSFICWDDGNQSLKECKSLWSGLAVVKQSLEVYEGTEVH